MGKLKVLKSEKYKNIFSLFSHAEKQMIVNNKLY